MNKYVFGLVESSAAKIMLTIQDHVEAVRRALTLPDDKSLR